VSRHEAIGACRLVKKTTSCKSISRGYASFEAERGKIPTRKQQRVAESLLVPGTVQENAILGLKRGTRPAGQGDE